MPVIQSQGVGYYNYYDISSRYKCETPYVNWYNRDLSKDEIGSNNSGTLNSESKGADICRKLESIYAGVAEYNRSIYSTVTDLRNALYQKYGDFGPYSNYSKDERNAMYLNELSMTCFGTIGNFTGMGGGDYYCDPRLNGKVTENKNTDTKEFNLKTLGQQFMNVFSNNNVDTSLFGNTRFSFTVDGKTKRLSVSIIQDDDTNPVDDTVIQQITDALNTNNNAKNLFYNMLYNANKQGKIPEAVLLKYRLYSEFNQETGLDISDFKQTKDGLVNDKGEYARDIYKKALRNSEIVPAEFKGAAYEAFVENEKNLLQYDVESIPDLELSMEYQNGFVIFDDGDNGFDVKA
jgi:hypothetical protein